MNEKLATRDRLLQAATELFMNKGFEKTSVADICDLAEANISAVNYHFGDKQRMFTEILQNEFERINERYPVPQGFENQNSYSQLETAIDLLLDRSVFEEGEEGHPFKLIRTLNFELDLFAEIRRVFFNPNIREFERFLKEYLGPKAIEEDVILTAMICVTLCTHLGVLLSEDHWEERHIQVGDLRAAIKAFILAGIRAKKTEIENRENETI